ncbi:hypothetical protein XacyCFBP2565_08655 [Xanthomonas arboricola pv. corylina]|nr:hypothetical protein XacyCFBP2565_08655 [Xanthomonas arboricola pv. corylina]
MILTCALTTDYRIQVKLRIATFRNADNPTIEIMFHGNLRQFFCAPLILACNLFGVDSKPNVVAAFINIITAT